MEAVSLKETLGKAIGKIASGLYVVTTGSGEQKQGFLASWIMQASFEPPMLTVAVQKDRDILKLIEENKRFVVNVLSDSNSNLMGKFAKYSPEQFQDVPAYENDHGVVLKDTVAFMACDLVRVWSEGGDHVLLVGQIVDGEVMNADLQPWTHLRKNGFSY